MWKQERFVTERVVVGLRGSMNGLWTKSCGRPCVAAGMVCDH